VRTRSEPALWAPQGKRAGPVKTMVRLRSPQAGLQNMEMTAVADSYPAALSSSRMTRRSVASSGS
jgi:hypothetical protein